MESTPPATLPTAEYRLDALAAGRTHGAAHIQQMVAVKETVFTTTLLDDNNQIHDKAAVVLDCQYITSLEEQPLTYISFS